MTPKEYREIRKSMRLTGDNLAYLLGYKSRSSVCWIEQGRPVDKNGHLTKRYSLAILAVKERYDQGKLDDKLGDT